jgi:hypothetical protein
MSRYRVILERFQNTDDRGASAFLATLTVSEKRSAPRPYHCMPLAPALPAADRSRPAPVPAV